MPDQKRNSQSQLIQIYPPVPWISSVNYFFQGALIQTGELSLSYKNQELKIQTPGKALYSSVINKTYSTICLPGLSIRLQHM